MNIYTTQTTLEDMLLLADECAQMGKGGRHDLEFGNLSQRPREGEGGSLR